MSNIDATKTESGTESTPTDGLSTWDEIRQMADEIELQVHLAGMDARDRWRALEPRLTALERWFERSGAKVGEAVTKELSAVGSLLRKLRADLTNGDVH